MIAKEAGRVRRPARARATGLVALVTLMLVALVLALAACAGPREGDAEPRGSGTGPSGSDAARSESGTGPSESGTRPSRSGTGPSEGGAGRPVSPASPSAGVNREAPAAGVVREPSGNPPPAVAAVPASCPQPAQEADDLRAAPVRSSWRALPAGEGHGTLDQLAVSGDGTLWALRSVQRETAAGMETTSGGLLRWDGTRRRTYALPPGARPVAIGALSAGRAWVFGAQGDHPGLVTTVADGTVTDRSLLLAGAPSIGLHGTAARGPWAVSGRTALRWDGAAWHEYHLPAPAQAIGGQDTKTPESDTGETAGTGRTGDTSGTSGTVGTVWTVGAGGAAARWTGTAWQAVAVPRPGTPRGAESPRTLLADVAVLGPEDVWVVGGVSWLARGAYDDQGEPLERLRPVALHWDGHAWRCRWGPPGVTFTQAEPDGHGGMWTLDSTRSRLHHYAAGRWTSTKIPGTITALAHRPGTTEVYAAGWTGRDGALTTPALWMTR